MNSPHTPTDVTAALTTELLWLQQVIDARFAQHFQTERTPGASFQLPPAPALRGDSRYATLLGEYGAGLEQRLLLILALAPHVAPANLDVFFLRNQTTDRGYTEFGGIKGARHAGFLPTGETALFLLAGDDLGRRLHSIPLLGRTQPLFARGVLRLAETAAGEPEWSGALSISPHVLRQLLTGETARPDFAPNFPATRITTLLTWSDLVLETSALEEMQGIKAWVQHSRSLREDLDLGRYLAPGFRALFHGPPGTGKTLAATLLGRELGVDVYRVDLSQVVSKYIGETERNLAAVFAEASARNGILFFDEADALFGKRTATSSAHDRYAHQEVSLFLRQIEDHPGVVILASSLKSNLDAVWARKFQAVIYFPIPDAAQRLRLWKNMLGGRVQLADPDPLPAIARDHEVTGGQIADIVRYTCLLALRRGGPLVITEADLVAGIRRELRKEGK